MHCILRDFSWSPKRASIDGRRIPSGNVLVGADWHGLCGKDSGWMPVGMEKMRQLYFARDTGCFPSDLRPWLAIMNQNRWVCPAVSKAAKAGTTASRCAGHLATNNGCCGSELHKPGSRGKVTISWRALGAHHLHPRFDLWKDTRSRPKRWVCRTSGGPGVVSRCRLCVPLCTAAFRLRPQGLVTRLERCLDFFHVPDVLCWSSTFPDVWVKVGVPGPHLESSRGSALGNWKKEQRFWGKSGIVKALLFLFLTVFWGGRTHFVVSGGQALSCIFGRRNALICIFSKDQRIYRCSFEVSEVASRWFFSVSSRSAKNDPMISSIAKHQMISPANESDTSKPCIRPTCSNLGSRVSPLAIFGSVGFDQSWLEATWQYSTCFWNCGHDQCPRTPHCVENFDVSLRGWLQHTATIGWYPESDRIYHQLTIEHSDIVPLANSEASTISQHWSHQQVYSGLLYSQFSLWFTIIIYYGLLWFTMVCYGFLSLLIQFSHSQFPATMIEAATGAILAAQPSW